MLVITVLLGGYSPLRSVSRSPRKPLSPPLALFSQNETIQLKLFT